MVKTKTIQVRITMSLYHDILKVKKEVEKNKRKSITFSGASTEFQKRRLRMGGRLT